MIPAGGNPMSSALRRTKMRHFVVLILFASNTILFAAGSPDLAVAIRNGDHAQARKLIEAGAGGKTPDKERATGFMPFGLESDRKKNKLLGGKRGHLNMKKGEDFHGIE